MPSTTRYYVRRVPRGENSRRDYYDYDYDRDSYSHSQSHSSSRSSRPTYESASRSRNTTSRTTSGSSSKQSRSGPRYEIRTPRRNKGDKERSHYTTRDDEDSDRYEHSDTDSDAAPPPRTHRRDYDDYAKSHGAFSSEDPVLFDEYVSENSMSVVSCHTEGESVDVVVGGIPHIPGATMEYKQLEFMRKHEWRRDQLMNEPRGRCDLNAVFMLPPCNPRAVRGLIFSKSEEYVPISISSLIAATQVTINGPGTEFDNLRVPITSLSFDTPAGLIDVDVRLKAGRSRDAIPQCESITVHGVPSFVLKLDFELDLYGLGIFSVDIAYGGVICAFVDAASVGVSIDDGNGQKMIDIGERIKNALQEVCEIANPLEPTANQVNTVVFIDRAGVEGTEAYKTTIMAAVISPGRLDRSPSGTAVCARLAILHARGEISKEVLTCQSIIGTKFHGRIRGKTKVDKYPAILPSVMGRAWIHSLKQVGMNPNDPFPEGFRNADHWGSDDYKNKRSYKPQDLAIPADW